MTVGQGNPIPPTLAAPGYNAGSLVDGGVVDANGGSGSGSNEAHVDLSGDWKAFWSRKQTVGGDSGRDRREITNSDNYKSQTDMQVWLQSQWQKNARFRTIMNQYAVAIPGYGTGYKAVSQMWDHAGAYSAQLAASGKAFLTPMQVLQLWAGGKATGLGNSPIGGNGSGSQTHTSSQVSYDISDPATAKALTNAVLSSALGREASDSEIATYRNALNAYEKSNPSTSTSTTTTDASGNSKTTSSSKSGANSTGGQQVLKDKASATAEGQAYQGQDMFEKAMQILASKVG